ncbi:adenylyl-sulfate kinase [Abyssalbus ytuae]|uniref:Adenylyl-sulfate kinase n=1 Tax=Abyssalbus ytuae TaxID=2926907 RepID=A0A9E6ZK68_9FLAO|nr:adenylyl-sulfate kinase [Abyssalbus ytuae]UOB16039.1 adenylyl-sulfate kinase [Abyssalbus ytuae]
MKKNQQQKAKVIWFTGLSGSGKSTLANELNKKLLEKSFLCVLLDSDSIRKGINRDLGYDEHDRKENIRRVSEISKLFIDTGVIVISAFISPTKDIRNLSKKIIGKNNFIEVFVNTPLNICESRDVKGLYKKAREGKLKKFTGISSPFEPPLDPQIVLNADSKNVSECIGDLLKFVLPQIDS